jgi:capsular polysaccharide biosynthesis protein
VEEINLYDLLKHYAKNWMNILTGVLLGAIIGLIYTNFVQVPLYKSEATLLVVSAGQNRTTQDTVLINNYTELFKSRRVLQAVVDQEKYGAGYEQLLNRTTATNGKDTDVIKVSIADTNPDTSTRLLKQSLTIFKKEAEALYNSNNIQIVDEASTPTKPYNVRVLMQMGLSIAAGFMAAVIVLFFVYDYKMSNGGKNAALAATVEKSSTSKQAIAPKPQKTARQTQTKTPKRTRLPSCAYFNCTELSATPRGRRAT